MRGKDDVWVDTSSLSFAGVLLEMNGSAIEDGCWLYPEPDMQHINLVALDVKMEGKGPPPKKTTLYVFIAGLLTL